MMTEIENTIFFTHVKEFQHLVRKIQIKYLFRINKHKNQIINLNKTYLKNG